MYKVGRYTTASLPGLVVTCFGMSVESGQTGQRGGSFFAPETARPRAFRARLSKTSPGS